MRKINNVRLVYFSGTGNTARVADCFEKSLQERDILVNKCELREGQKWPDFKEDMLLLLYVVHAFNAPEPVYEWIKSIPKVYKIPAVVISVSAGGEVTPNTACRTGCISRLQKKGYDVFYEKMIVMPSNWIVPTVEPIAVKLLEVLPSKVERVVKHILSGVKHRTRANILDIFLSALGELEKYGVRFFGKRLKVGDSCNSCGWCEKSCPRGNIQLDSGKPVFGKKCLLCTKCIYGCPKKAINPALFKFIIIKEGYSLNLLEKKIPYHEPVNIEELAKGSLWKGVRNYLLDADE